MNRMEERGSKPESEIKCTTERGKKKETKNPKLSITFIHGRFHHFPCHHFSWWPLHCYTLHNTLIESMYTNLYAFYRFAIYLIVSMLHRPVCLSFALRVWCSPTKTHSLSSQLHSVFVFSTIQTRCMPISAPIRFRSKAISIWSAACLNRIYVLVSIDVCGFERYNCEWQCEFIVTVCLCPTSMCWMMFCLNSRPQKSVNSIFIKFSTETFWISYNKPNESMPENGAKWQENLPFLCAYTSVYSFIPQS